MYHDAYSTLQRQPPAAPTRERHASAGINGHALEMEVPTRAHGKALGNYVLHFSCKVMTHLKPLDNTMGCLSPGIWHLAVY